MTGIMTDTTRRGTDTMTGDPRPATMIEVTRGPTTTTAPPDTARRGTLTTTGTRGTGRERGTTRIGTEMNGTETRGTGTLIGTRDTRGTTMRGTDTRDILHPTTTPAPAEDLAL